MLTATDTGLELMPWTVVIDKSVNPVLPTAYAASNTPDGLASYVVGPPWSGALAKLERPVIPGCFKPSLTVSVCPDSAAAVLAQAMEFDLRIQLGGLNYNLSAQINDSEGGMLQVSTASGGWIDTGCKVGKLPPNVWTTLQFNYAFDTAKRVYSVLSVNVGLESFAIPVTLQNVPAAAMNWQDNIAVIQIQLDLNQQGGACSHKTKVSLAWA